MILGVFILIQSYFFIGAMLFGIARRKQLPGRKSPWSKFFIYMLVVNLISFSVSKNIMLFHLITLFIVFQGLWELIRALRKRVKKSRVFEIAVLTLYLLLSCCFIAFSKMSAQLILWIYVIIFLFDGFSQICGQLFGRRKLAPSISPNKTLEGTLGGLTVTMLSLWFLDNLSDMSAVKTIVYGLFICTGALIGDLLASYVKRKCEIKDFGRLLPGHGGILDRFDSFLFSGALVFATEFIFGRIVF